MAKKIKKLTDLPRGMVKQMLTLSTAAFGLVMALAWNEFIQELVDSQIRPYFNGGTLISLFVYALVVTILAVIVTYQLSLMTIALTGTEKEKEPISNN